MRSMPGQDMVVPVQDELERTAFGSLYSAVRSPPPVEKTLPQVQLVAFDRRSGGSDGRPCACSPAVVRLAVLHYCSKWKCQHARPGEEGR